METNNRIPVIVCGGKTGKCVIYGYVDTLPVVDQPVEMHDARMVIRWATAGLFDLAVRGPRGNTRITAAVPWVIDTCRQALSVTPVAAAAIDAWRAFE
jgi:hypothetical protein